jgi:hypothetical protein
MAAGAGNQRLYVSREKKLVVVRQAEGIVNALVGDRSVKWSDAEFLYRLLFGTDVAGKPVEAGAEPAPDPAADRAKALEQFRKRFDKDGDGQLNESERAALREFLRQRVGGTAPPPEK